MNTLRVCGLLYKACLVHIPDNIPNCVQEFSAEICSSDYDECAEASNAKPKKSTILGSKNQPKSK